MNSTFMFNLYLSLIGPPAVSSKDLQLFKDFKKYQMMSKSKYRCLHEKNKENVVLDRRDVTYGKLST